VVLVLEIKLKKTEPWQATTIKHVGPYKEVGKLYEEIAKWLRQKQLKITGPPFGWFYDNPEEVPANRLRSEVGFPFKGEAKHVKTSITSSQTFHEPHEMISSFRTVLSV